MAKAKAKCTCKTCGATFTMTKTCFNRSEADSWEEWAIGRYDECTDCWKARKSKENAHIGISVRVILTGNSIILRAVKEWDFYSVKNDVKKAGFDYNGSCWEKEFPLIDFRIMSDNDLKKLQSDDAFICDYIPQHAVGQVLKAKEFVLNALEVVNKANGLEGEITDDNDVLNKDSAADFYINAEQLDRVKKAAEIELEDRRENRAEREAKQAREKALADAKPDFLEGVYWNGKIYGKNKNEIYLSNEKKVLNDDELEQLNKYIVLKSK